MTISTRSDGSLTLRGASNGAPNRRQGRKSEGAPTASIAPGVGWVALVGAGPGDPELITVRGQRRLEVADVVVYDRLVSLELVETVPPECERVYVGKAPGRVTVPQDEICRLLVDRAAAGQRVVRLKGGDPFVFGRGGEEMLACLQADIPCEIVPGLSSALAAPGLAGIPLTHRGLATSFLVVTGQVGTANQEPEWASFVSVDTLVLLMGVRRLSEIAATLVASGKDPSTPVGIVERASWPDERCTVTSLDRLGVGSSDADPGGVDIGPRFSSPAVVVIGEVVGLWGTPRARSARDVSGHPARGLCVAAPPAV